MISSIIGLLLNISSFIFLLLNIRLLKKRDLISYNLEHGIICYNCKDDIVYDKNELQN